MTSKRTIERRLDDLESENTVREYPRPTVAELLSADEVRVGPSIESGHIVVVDGEKMAVSEQGFKLFWQKDLEQGGNR